MGILDFFSYGPNAKRLVSDYKLGGIIFSIFYLVSTCILPNIYMIYFEQYKNMDKVSLFFWFGIQILWQLMVMYSIYTHLNDVNSNKDDINSYTYNLFVKGGWHNFQRWMSYYAQDVWGDIILLSFVFVLPIGIFDNIKPKEKLQFIFTKIGLFFVFMFFILGPPVYHISDKEVTLNNYLNNVFQFEGSPNKVGYFNYLYDNKSKIIQVIISFVLLINIFISGKGLKLKIMEKRKKKK